MTARRTRLRRSVRTPRAPTRSAQTGAPRPQPDAVAGRDRPSSARAGRPCADPRPARACGHLRPRRDHVRSLLPRWPRRCADAHAHRPGHLPPRETPSCPACRPGLPVPALRCATPRQPDSPNDSVNPPASIDHRRCVAGRSPPAAHAAHFPHVVLSPWVPGSDHRPCAACPGRHVLSLSVPAARRPRRGPRHSGPLGCRHRGRPAADFRGRRPAAVDRQHPSRARRRSRRRVDPVVAPGRRTNAADWSPVQVCPSATRDAKHPRGHHC